MAVGVRYDVGGGLTAIDGDMAPLLTGLPSTPVELCAVAQGLVMLPNLAAGFGVPEERQEERSIRAASDILRVHRRHDDQGEFLTGGEAWIRCREGRADPSTFGVDGYPENFGIGEIRGNLVRDPAALNKVETLPWDEWGRMAASYAGETGPDYDELMDAIAAACASGDEAAIAGLYASHDLAVPPELL